MPDCEFRAQGTSASIANITHWTTTFLVTRFFKDVLVIAVDTNWQNSSEFK